MQVNRNYLRGRIYFALTHTRRCAIVAGMKHSPSSKRPTIMLPTAAEIERLAREAGLTIPSLCEMANVAPSTFYRWRNGNAKMMPDTMQCLLDAINSASAA